MLTRRRFLSHCAAGIAVAVSGCTTRRPPNLVLLLADDQRWDTLGAAGNPVIQTPELDRLARGGTHFANAFVTTSICPSSRASILSGCYTSRHGVVDFGGALGPREARQAYPPLLRAAGYRTGFVGKWGLGAAPAADFFDFQSGFLGQGEYALEVAGRRRQVDDLLADRALEFLGTVGSEPFCLSLSFKAPHPPWKDFDPALAGLYRGARMPLAATANAQDAARLPDFLRQSRGGQFMLRSRDFQRALEGMTRRYYRMISGLDAVVGRLLRALEARDLREHTVVLFSSDNGSFLGEHGLTGKWLMYEEAIRVPLLISDPRVPAGLRGRRCDVLALNIDLAPTLLDLAGVAIPEAMQGSSLVPFVYGANPAWRSDFLYEMPAQPSEGVLGCEGLRSERWKYIRYAGVEPLRESLFDLEHDPGETRDLASDPEFSSVLAELRSRWEHHPARSADKAAS